MSQLEFDPNSTLDIVRDIFVFCCYTGLAYSDIKRLSEKDLEKDKLGNLWIQMTRKKTDNSFCVPILDPLPLAILEKYKLYHRTNKNHRYFPVFANQTMNEYIKFVAVLSGIKKRLTTHVARHTFGTLRTSEGVSIENVRKMMGHSSVLMTERYVQVLDDAILNDMKNTMHKRSV